MKRMEYEAESILSIPLSTSLLADKLVQVARKNGKFCMKNANHLTRVGDWRENGTGKLKYFKYEMIFGGFVKGKGS